MLEKRWVRNSAIAGLALLCLLLIVSLKQVLAPVFVALTIAYIGDPVIDWFEARKISRTAGIVILISLFVLMCVGFSLYLTPRLVGEITDLVQAMPGYWARFNEWIRPHIEGHEAEVTEYTEKAIAWAEENAGVLAQHTTDVLITSLKSMGSFLSSLLGLIIIPVLAFYLLRDFDIMTGQAQKLIPIDKRDLVVDLFSELHLALINFIKGQLLVALILTVIYSNGL